jgi:hypothetical protein
MEYVEVRTQADLDKALERDDVIPLLAGSGRFEVTEGEHEIHVREGSPTLVSWGSSTLNAVSRESSTLNAESRESSTLNAVSRGSSTLNAVSRGSSTLRAESRGSSTLNLEVGPHSCAVIREIKGAAHKIKPVIIEGGQVIELRAPDISTPEKWCEYHGVAVNDGVATLYKALDSDFGASSDFSYRPGTEPAAPDWDGGTRECGGGLHFSPTPGHALEFNPDAKRFVACPVRLAVIVVHPDGQFPQKVKAPRVCGPVIEVDRDGKPV